MTVSRYRNYEWIRRLPNDYRKLRMVDKKWKRRGTTRDTVRESGPVGSILRMVYHVIQKRRTVWRFRHGTAPLIYFLSSSSPSLPPFPSSTASFLPVSRGPTPEPVGSLGSAVAFCSGSMANFQPTNDFVAHLNQKSSSRGDRRVFVDFHKKTVE